MRTDKKIIITVAAIFAFMTFSAFALAAPAGSTYSLTATKKFPDASGAAVVSDRHIDIRATGLKPNSVYTVWFVNMKPKKQEAGAGQAPYMFKTDAKGHGTYAARSSLHFFVSDLQNLLPCMPTFGRKLSGAKGALRAGRKLAALKQCGPCATIALTKTAFSPLL